MTASGSTAVIGLRSMRDFPAVRAAYHVKLLHAIPVLHAVRVQVGSAALRALVADPRIRYVSPEGRGRRIAAAPNDPLVWSLDPLTGRPYEWQFMSSRVDRAFDFTHGSPAVVVGIIDTGVDVVPDLAGKVDSLWSVAPDGAVVADSLTSGNDDVGHGTAVASVIGANPDDGIGMVGYGGATHVIAVHVGYQGFFNDTSIAIALMKLDTLGVPIVNMSLGAPVPSTPILVDAIHKAAADGILLVAAAGNAHGDVAWPAAALQPSGGGRSFGLAVGATDFQGALATFSNSGKHLSLVAPGTYGDPCSSGVLVALPPSSLFADPASCAPRWGDPSGAVYAYASGTSFAAPEVAGIAALIWAARPELSNYQVADIIKQSARRTAGTGWTPTMGCGVLDAGAALELATRFTSAGAGTPGAPCSVDGAQPAAWPSELDQTIVFPALKDRRLPAQDFRVRATASSGLKVSFSATGTCTLVSAMVHVTGIGVCAITASQAGNDSYNPARPVVRTFAITHARATVARARTN